MQINSLISVKPSCCQNRVLFGPFIESQNDFTPSGRSGARCYARITGFFLSLFGFAIQIHHAHGILYLNKNSIEKWLARHGVKTEKTGRRCAFINTNIHDAPRLTTYEQAIDAACTGKINLAPDPISAEKTGTQDPTAISEPVEQRTKKIGLRQFVRSAYHYYKAFDTFKSTLQELRVPLNVMRRVAQQFLPELIKKCYTQEGELSNYYVRDQLKNLLMSPVKNNPRNNRTMEATELVRFIMSHRAIAQQQRIAAKSQPKNESVRMTMAEEVEKEAERLEREAEDLINHENTVKIRSAELSSQETLFPFYTLDEIPPHRIFLTEEAAIQWNQEYGETAEMPVRYVINEKLKMNWPKDNLFHLPKKAVDQPPFGKGVKRVELVSGPSSKPENITMTVHPKNVAHVNMIAWESIASILDEMVASYVEEHGTEIEKAYQERGVQMDETEKGNLIECLADDLTQDFFQNRLKYDAVLMCHPEKNPVLVLYTPHDRDVLQIKENL